MKNPFNFDFRKAGFRARRFTSRHFSLDTIDLTHGISFLLGIFLTFGFFAVDERLSTTAYSASNNKVATVVSAAPEGSVAVHKTSALRASSSEAFLDENAELSLEEEEVAQDEVVPATTEPEEETEVVEDVAPQEPEPEPDTTALTQQVAAALVSAQEQLAGLQENVVEAESEEEVSADSSDCFVTPTGKKFDSKGNELNDDCSSKVLAQDTNVNNGDGTVTKVADGFFKLPNGKWTDTSGTLYDEPPTITQYTGQTNPQDEYFTTPGGVVMDRFGNIISRPEVIDPDIVDDSDITVLGGVAPALNSTIVIPKYIATRVYLNPQITCSSFNYHGNDLELCKLYRNNKDDYTWDEVKTE